MLFLFLTISEHFAKNSMKPQGLTSQQYWLGQSLSSAHELELLPVYMRGVSMAISFTQDSEALQLFTLSPLYVSE